MTQSTQLTHSFKDWTPAELLNCQSSGLVNRSLSLREKANLRAAYYQVQHSHNTPQISPVTKVERLCEAAHHLQTLELWPILHELCFSTETPEETPLYQQLSNVGLLTEQIELCESLLGKFDPIEDAQLIYTLGMAHAYLCKYVIATDYFQRLLEQADKTKAIADQIKALSGFSFCYDQWGRHLIAIEYCQKQLQLWSYLETTHRNHAEFLQLKAQTYSILGRSYMFLRKSKQAIRFFDLALTLSQDNHDQKAQWYIFGRLAFVYAGLGQHKTALKFLDQQQQLQQEAPREQGIRALVLGMTCCFDNDFLGAEQFFQESVESSRRAQDYNVQCFSMLALVLIQTFQKNYQQAIAIAHEALAIARDLEYYHHECSALFQLSSIHAELEELEPCITYAEGAVAISHNLAIPSYKASALSALSGAYLLQNKYWAFLKILTRVIREMSIPLTRDSKILILIIIRKIVKHMIRKFRGLHKTPLKKAGK